MSKKATTYPDIEKAVKKMLETATTFEERKQSLEVAIKFATLQLKSKGNQYGKGFLEEDEIDEDN